MAEINLDQAREAHAALERDGRALTRLLVAAALVVPVVLAEGSTFRVRFPGGAA